jgi:hypothetical protein
MLMWSPRLKFCAERGRLLDLLNRATSDYANAVGKLFPGIAHPAEKDYDRKCSDVDSARLSAEQAREALLIHRMEHGC